MAERLWHVARGTERRGPMTGTQLRESMGRGEVLETDLVWTEGMNDWKAVKNTPEVHEAGAGVVAGQVSPMLVARTQIGYFSGSGMPPRAQATLAGHERPRGDVGDWPLDDVRVADFSEAVKYRKLVTGAAGLYRALLLLSLIAAVIFTIGMMAMFSNAQRGRGAAPVWAVGIPGLIFMAMSVLYFICWKATMRSRRWAPLTMFILFVVGMVLNLGTCAMIAQASPEPAAMVGNLVGMLLSGLFAYISWRSYANIPKYLAHPAWCQELIVRAGL